MTPLEALCGSPARAALLAYLADHEDQHVKSNALKRCCGGTQYIRYMRQFATAGLVDKVHYNNRQQGWSVEPHPLWELVRKAHNGTA